MLEIEPAEARSPTDDRGRHERPLPGDDAERKREDEDFRGVHRKSTNLPPLVNRMTSSNEISVKSYDQPNPSLPQNPVFHTKIFFWIAPSMTRINPIAASCWSTPKISATPPASSATARKTVKLLGIPMLLLRASGSLRSL